VKAVVQERFGAPDTLRVADTDVPAIGPGEVLVRVHAAALNPYDWHVLRGDPYLARLLGVGLTRPRCRVAGIDVAGRVEAVGAGVSDVRAGEEVYGFCRGALAEYAAASADLVVPKPAALTFEQAAALPLAATTAVVGIREVAAVRAGQRVLVNGAAGGIGTCAVQVAAALGAEVTGVCGPRNVRLLRDLGATHVVDYTGSDFTGRRGHYDVILDNVGNHRLSELCGALTRRGTLVANSGGTPGHLVGAIGNRVRAAALNPFVPQRIRQIPTRQRRADLLAVTELVAAGQLTPVLDRTCPLSETAAALRYVEQGHARGKVVVSVP
jgi:NADPH:quinone reductase-like Zn-dependent oxidoreductase